MIEIIDILDWKYSQGVYMIKNIVNQKIYVGSAVFTQKDDRITRSIHIRLRDHIYALNKGNHVNPHLQNAWKKYGAVQFKLYVLELVQDNTLIAEQKWIDSLKACDPQIGYNIAVLASAPMYGRHHSNETKEKLRIISSNRKHSEESKKKMSQWQIGKVLSEETKRKISESEKGKIIPLELRERWSKSRKGRKLSEAAKKTMSKSARTRVLTEEDILTIRQRISSGDKLSHIASDYCVTKSNICAIKNRRTWKYI